MVRRSGQNRERATLCWAVVLSVAAHASVFCGAAAPRANRAADSVAATLVMVDRGAAQTPPPSAVAPTPASASRANAAINPGERSRRAGTAHRVAEAAQRHYPTAELDKRSFPLAQLDFPYPALIGDGWQGTLELTLYVGKDGVVDRVEVDFASVDQRLVELAIESLRATPFSPGERRGRAVGARLRLAVDYALSAP